MMELVVSRRSAGWFVDTPDERHGPYLGFHDALADAIDAAHDTGTDEVPTRVLVTRSRAQKSVVWTWGRDPYPPPPATSNGENSGMERQIARDAAEPRKPPASRRPPAVRRAFRTDGA